jgi:sigma-54 dependent transcriptional regulator, acetoin dehydrogenase operon transcriptional activator AcoR
MGRLGWGNLPALEGAAPASPARVPAPGGGADIALLLELRAKQWNVSLAARRIGVARMTLYRRVKRAGIVAPNQRDVADD